MTSATLSISGSAPVTPIRQEIFGYFIEHFHRLIYGGIFEPGSPLSDERGFRLDVADALRELGTGVVRWPGGCFVSAYHWVDGVGPDRKPRFDKAWRVDEPNTFGTAEFIQWCELVGATPYLCTNAGTGTPEEMADWLEYCNSNGSGSWAQLRREHGNVDAFGVPYWSIGNENYGTWEIGAKSAEEWSRYVTESAKMMRRVDPSVHLLTAARADLDWTLPLLKSAGPYLDSVAIHGYWDPLWIDDSPIDYLTAVGRSMQPEQDIRAMRSIIRAAGYENEISIAFDEWNLRGWHHPPGGDDDAIAARDRNDRHETYTMADAVFSAGFLNGCLRNADVVSMANLAPLVNGRGPLFVDSTGIVKRTTYYLMQMYARLLGAEYVESTASSATLDCGDGVHIPAVDAVVTRRGDALVIALVNRHPDAILDCGISIDGVAVTGTAQRTTLTGDSTDAFNSPENPDRVVPTVSQEHMDDGKVTLPAHSITVLEIPQSVAPTVGDWIRGEGQQWREIEPTSSGAKPHVDWAF
ncbi:alpha-L-arabinofuranosidase C-terminal domain-containing protein [Microbacterium sp. UFMG61]|uniref:alpha-L-arabinofuranosidase C-terminal domain-containing protein n=1 Tax=Microbacterium sp. UFMG61 TaxID=2745935 RepID=UPI00188F1FD2|nr:alpha-L-arabinofuranosidase C-terminal domain-containing protein [Microbacterium sp. UFMG61]